MIISASYRTDIPAFYGSWFEYRFRAGWAMVANPYGGRPSRVPLREGVDGYVFWTRNIEPFLPALALVRDGDLPFIVHYTVTNYPRQLEASVIPADRSLGLIRRLAGDYGGRAAVWRYDPIVITELTPPGWHLDNFTGLAAGLAGAVDEVVVSFAQIYRKTARNLAAAAKSHHFAWRDPSLEEKGRLLARLATIARAHGMRLTLCTQPDLVTGNIEAARCIDPARLSDLAGRVLASRLKGNRPGCFCAESRDIGDYDSCPHGCAYCYAVNSRRLAKQRFRNHDPAGEFLAFPPPGP